MSNPNEPKRGNQYNSKECACHNVHSFPSHQIGLSRKDCSYLLWYLTHNDGHGLFIPNLRPSTTRSRCPCVEYQVSPTPPRKERNIRVRDFVISPCQ